MPSATISSGATSKTYLKPLNNGRGGFRRFAPDFALACVQTSSLQPDRRTMTDHNPFLLTLVLPIYQSRENGTQPAEPVFTPFNLAYLQNVPQRTERRKAADEVKAQQPEKVEAFA